MPAAGAKGQGARLQEHKHTCTTRHTPLRAAGAKGQGGHLQKHRHKRTTRHTPQNGTQAAHLWALISKCPGQRHVCVHVRARSVRACIWGGEQTHLLGCACAGGGRERATSVACALMAAPPHSAAQHQLAQRPGGDAWGKRRAPSPHTKGGTSTQRSTALASTALQRTMLGAGDAPRTRAPEVTAHTAPLCLGQQPHTLPHA